MVEELNDLISKAEKGDVDAMIMIGDCYNRGLYVEKDIQQSHKYYQMAADKGQRQARLIVAIDLIYGIGVYPDKKKGEKYLIRAARSGLADAQYMLGCRYKNGEMGFLGCNIPKAIRYFKMAARQGDARAQIELADLFIYKSTSCTFNDMIFWLACAYLHDKEQESKMALQRINFLISNGSPGGKERIEDMINKVKKNYIGYTRSPSSK